MVINVINILFWIHSGTLWGFFVRTEYWRISRSYSNPSRSGEDITHGRVVLFLGDFWVVWAAMDLLKAKITGFWICAR